MQKFISFNGQIAAIEDALISAVSSAALYGNGIFTTIAVYDRMPFHWEKHWQRLENNACKLKIDIAEFSKSAVKEALDEAIQENGINDGRARVTLFDASASAVWPFENERKTSLLILTGELRPAPENLQLTVSPFPINSISPLAGIKSCNYLENLLAFDEARERGFDEAIRLNERGDVASACMANVFWLKNDVLHTPSLKTGCLPGTMREFVLEDFECSEVEETADGLRSANAIFLTSAGLGVTQVSRFESREFKKIEHPILDLLPKRN